MSLWHVKIWINCDSALTASYPNKSNECICFIKKNYIKFMICILLTFLPNVLNFANKPKLTQICLL